MSTLFHMKEVLTAFDFTFGKNRQQQPKYNFVYRKSRYGYLAKHLNEYLIENSSFRFSFFGHLKGCGFFVPPLNSINISFSHTNFYIA